MLKFIKNNMLKKEEISEIITKTLKVKFSSDSNQMNFIDIIDRLTNFTFDFYQKNNEININLAK
jgi:hypothetical protein